MVSSHSMYKHPSKIAKATPYQKDHSKMQRKLNMERKEKKKMILIAQARKIMLNKHGEVFAKLVNEKIITKEYLRPYLPRYRDILKELQKLKGASNETTKQ